MMISSSSPRPDEQVLRHGAQISDAAPTHVGRPTRDTRPTAQSQGWRLVAALHKLTEDDVQLNRMPWLQTSQTGEAHLAWPHRRGQHLADRTRSQFKVRAPAAHLNRSASSLLGAPRRPFLPTSSIPGHCQATPPHDFKVRLQGPTFHSLPMGSAWIVCHPHVVSACSLLQELWVIRLCSKVRSPPHPPLLVSASSVVFTSFVLPVALFQVRALI